MRLRESSAAGQDADKIHHARPDHRRCRPQRFGVNDGRDRIRCVVEPIGRFECEYQDQDGRRESKWPWRKMAQRAQASLLRRFYPQRPRLATVPERAPTIQRDERCGLAGTGACGRRERKASRGYRRPFPADRIAQLRRGHRRPVGADHAAAINSATRRGGYSASRSRNCGQPTVWASSQAGSCRPSATRT